MSEASTGYNWSAVFGAPVADGSRRREEENRAVILHYQKLRSILADNATKTKGENSKEDLEAVLDQIKQATDGVGRFLSYQLHPKYYNELRPDNSTIASTALRIPEILELILQHVSHRDLMTMTQVSQDIREIVEASPKLQVQLYHKPVEPSKAKKGGYDTIFRSGEVQGFFVYTRSYNSTSPSYALHPDEKTGGVEAYFQMRKGHGLPAIGSRWKRMLICQPPVKHMRMDRICSRHYDLQQEFVGIDSETGLTVGDLFALAQQTLANQPACPHHRESDKVNESQRPNIEEQCEILSMQFWTCDPNQKHSKEGE